MLLRSILLLLVLSVPAWVTAQDEGREDDPLREPVPAKSDANAVKIVDAHLRARGGLERLAAARSLYTEETVREGKREYRVAVHRTRPSQIRRVTVTDGPPGEDDLKVIEGHDGQQAWVYDLTREHPFPKEIGGKEAKDLAAEADFLGPLYDWQAKGYVLQYEGKVSFRGRPQYLVKLYYPDGLSRYYYIDAQNFLVTREGWPENRQGVVVEMDLYHVKYRDVDGIWFPEKTELAITGKVYGSRELTDLRVNPPAAAQGYTMPKPREVWLRGDQ